MIISKPTVPMFSTPFPKSEMTDELLYGTEVEIIDKINDSLRVITEYGYKGWIAEDAVAQPVDKANATVVSAFCDLLPTAEYKYAPVMTLPKGARVDAAVPHEVEGRAMIILPDKRMYFVNEKSVMFDRDYRSESCKGCTKRCAFLNIASGNITRDAVADAAVGYLGTQYRWGGKTHAGIDCSGLVFMAYALCGVQIYRDADPEKQTKFENIPLSDAEKGDLLFFKGHVAMYLGDGKFIHSTPSRGGVAYGDTESDKGLFDSFITAKTLKEFHK